jgi:hypothetical protein
MAAGSFKTKEPAEMAIIMFFRIFEFRTGIFPGSIFLSGFGCLPDQPEINRWSGHPASDGIAGSGPKELVSAKQKAAHKEAGFTYVSIT